MGMREIANDNQVSLIAVIERVALDPNCDVSKMEKMLDMQERIFNKNAEIAFSKSMVACQGDMPTVIAKAVNTQTGSCYAKYEHLLEDIKPVYTKHGFSLSFGESPCAQEGHITVSCDVMHSDGYTKSYSSTLPIDLTGIKGAVNKTGIHATSSAYSYAKRYLATMIFNIAIANHDDDAIKAGGITIEKLLEYNAFLRENWPTVTAMKEGILFGDLSRAAEAWHELSNDEQMYLKLAPTKGGIFTTEERKVLAHNPDFGSAAP